MSIDLAGYAFDTLEVTDEGGHVLHVKLNRPKKLNAMNSQFWEDFRECFYKVAADPSVRAVVVSGNGRIFTTGLDLMGNSMPTGGSKDAGRKAFHIRRHVMHLQETFTAMERCPQPVIAAMHGACIGGGIDLATACDIRYASPECWFSIKEVDIGLAADVGTLQRIQKVVGNTGLVKELAFTARKFEAAEALSFGFLTRVYPQETLLAKAVEQAKAIAAKSPLAIAGTKVSLNFARDHTVADGLEQIAAWNGSALQTGDVIKAAQASFKKKNAEFAKL